jgi:hypothetical protein
MDTLSVHVRDTSPLHRTRSGFRDLVGNGAALIVFMGYHEWYFFSKAMYFTTWDVGSLAVHNRLSFWSFTSSQRFEREDTLAIGVGLMQSPGKGAVGCVGPTGHVFNIEYFGFVTDLFQEITDNPGIPIGSSLLSVKQTSSSRSYRTTALLADPALVIKQGIIAGTDEDPPSVPTGIHLYQNYPNPFNPSTTIEFVTGHRSFVNVSIYDLLGRKVATIVNGELGPGVHRREWDATDVSSGVYLYRLTAGDYVETKRMMVVR